MLSFTCAFLLIAAPLALLVSGGALPGGGSDGSGGKPGAVFTGAPGGDTDAGPDGAGVPMLTTGASRPTSGGPHPATAEEAVGAADGAAAGQLIDQGGSAVGGAGSGSGGGAPQAGSAGGGVTARSSAAASSTRTAGPTGGGDGGGGGGGGSQPQPTKTATPTRTSTAPPPKPTPPAATTTQPPGECICTLVCSISGVSNVLCVPNGGKLIWVPI